MARWDRLFEGLRRFNTAALALAIVGVAGVAVVGFGVLAVGALMGGGPRALVASAVDAGRSSSAEPLKTGAFRPMADTGLYWAAIERDGRLKGLFDSYAASGVADHLIYDPRTGAARHLFGAGDRLVSDARHLSWAEDATGDRARTVALFVLVIDEDANGDGRLSAADGGALMLGPPDGARLVNFGRGRALGAYLTSETEAVLFIGDREGDATEAVHVELPALRELRRVVLPAPAPGPGA